MKWLRSGRGTETTQCKFSLFPSKDIGTDSKSENRPTHVEDIDMDSEARWETSLKEREATRHVFTAITLAVAFFFVCIFLEEENILLWGRFLSKLESILDTCCKISQRLPSARKIWSSMQERRPIRQTNGLLKKIKNGNGGLDVWV